MDLNAFKIEEMSRKVMPTHISKAVEALKQVDVEYESCLQVLEDLTRSTQVDGPAIDKLKQVLSLGADRAREKERRTREVETCLRVKVQVIVDRRKLPSKRRVKASRSEYPAERVSSSGGAGATGKVKGRRSIGSKGKAGASGEGSLKRTVRRNLTVPFSSSETMSNSYCLSRSSHDLNMDLPKKGFKGRKSVDAKVKLTDARKFRDSDAKMVKVISAWKLKQGDGRKLDIYAGSSGSTDATDAGKFPGLDAGNIEETEGRKAKKDLRKKLRESVGGYLGEGETKWVDVSDASREKDKDSDASNFSVFSPLKEVQQPVKKRAWKRRKVSEEYEEEALSSRDFDPEEDLDEPKYCICNEMSYGDMIGCDNDLCPMEWFHFKCVQLASKPRGKWYCPRCRGDRPNVMKPKEVIMQELEQYNREKED